RAAILEWHPYDLVTGGSGGIPRAMQGDEGIALIGRGKLRTFVENQTERRGVRVKQEVGDQRLGLQIRALVAEVGIRMLAEIRIRPAIESAGNNMGEIVGDEFVAETVTLVDGDEEIVRTRIELQPDGIAQARRVRLQGTVRLDGLHCGARRPVFSDVALASDAEIERAFGIDREIARHVSARTEIAGRGNAVALSGPRRAFAVRESPDCFEVADVKSALGEEETMRGREALGEIMRFDFAVLVVQQGDPPHARLREKHVAVRHHRHPAWIAQARRIKQDGKSSWNLG